ncbi:MAG TPA: AEC family transporter [Nitrospira sp.]|nr:AEC family transporter [Nitrospira sp.]
MAPSLQYFLVLFLTGAALRSCGVLGKFHAERLAALVFSVSLPATILISLDRAPLSAAAWRLPVAACAITLPLIVISWPFLRLFRLPRATSGGFLLATGCINSVYFAYPVILATLGEPGLVHAVLFDLGQTTLTLTVLYGMAVWFGEADSTRRSPLRRLVSSPPLWALGAILLLRFFDLHLPSWLQTALTPLHWTTTPLASLVLGLSINLRSLHRTWRLAIMSVLLRMGGGFLIGLGAVTLLQLSGLERVVVLLIAGMPSAVTAVIFAAETGLDEELVASAVALSLCLGMAALPWFPDLAQALAS